MGEGKLPYARAGDQTIIATDQVASGVLGSTVVTITPLATTHFGISAPMTQAQPV